MEYKLYTLVDITRTGQYKSQAGQEAERWKEQNFNTVLQTLGIRANVNFITGPSTTEVRGRVVGFDTDKIIRVWRFDFFTDRNDLYKKDDNSIGLLLEDFHLVPYISGLGEQMEQQLTVFNTADPGKNIVFFAK